MDANKILSADVLDIVFEGRNKLYGAYDLRKNYRQRLGKSLLIMFSFLLLVVGANMLLGFVSPSDSGVIIVSDSIVLRKVEPLPQVKPIDPVVIKPPVGVKVPEKFKIKIYSTPLIVKDPPEEEKVPEVDKMDKVKIGTANINEGKETDGTVTAPPGEAQGLLSGKKNGDENDKTFIPIEKESEYPGGPKAWVKFLERNLFNNLPQDAVDNGIEGTVMLRFVVDVDGTISDIAVISGPKEYQDAAIRAIRKSGKWEPALQNGHNVKTYKMQAITVKLPQ